MPPIAILWVPTFELVHVGGAGEELCCWTVWWSGVCGVLCHLMDPRLEEAVNERRDQTCPTEQRCTNGQLVNPYW